MPVVFESPQPVAPGLSAEAGYAQEMAALGRHGLGGSTGPANFAALYGGGGRGRVMGGAADYDPGALAAQQQQAQLQAAMQMQAQTMTQAETLHMNRLQNGLSYIDQQLNQNTIDPETAQALKTQIWTGLNPLLAKQQIAKNAMIQEQVKNAQQANAIQAAGLSTLHQYLNNGGNGTPVFGQDGEQSGTLFLQPDPKGGFKTHFAPIAKAANKNPIPGTASYSTANDEKSFDTIFPKVRAEVMKSLTHTDANGKPVPPDPEDVDRETANTLDRMGYGTSKTAHVIKTALGAHGLTDLENPQKQGPLEDIARTYRERANQLIAQHDWPTLKRLGAMWQAQKVALRFSQGKAPEGQQAERSRNEVGAVTGTAAPIQSPQVVPAAPAPQAFGGRLPNVRGYVDQAGNLIRGAGDVIQGLMGAQ